MRHVLPSQGDVRFLCPGLPDRNALLEGTPSLCVQFSFSFFKLDNNYSTLNERGDHNRTLDRPGDLGEMEPLKGAPLMVNPLYVLLALSGHFCFEACMFCELGEEGIVEDGILFLRLFFFFREKVGLLIHVEISWAVNSVMVEMGEARL